MIQSIRSGKLREGKASYIRITAYAFAGSKRNVAGHIHLTCNDNLMRDDKNYM